MVFSKAACKDLMGAQINTQRREVAIQSLQCYNYSPFFLLDKHKGEFFSLPACILFLSLLSTPPLTAQLGEQPLIAPKSSGSTTSASHPGIIVSVGVGGLEKKEGFAAYRKGFVVCLGSRAGGTFGRM